MSAKRIFSIIKKDFLKSKISIIFSIPWMVVIYSLPFGVVTATSLKIKKSEMVFTEKFIFKNMFTLFALSILLLTTSVFYSIIVHKERREETFGLLFTTPCSLYDIILGKTLLVWLVSSVIYITTTIAFFIIIGILTGIFYIPSFSEIVSFFSILFFFFSFLIANFLIELLSTKWRDIFNTIRTLIAMLSIFMIVFLKITTMGYEFLFSAVLIIISFFILFFSYIRIKNTDKEKLFLNAITE